MKQVDAISGNNSKIDRGILYSNGEGKCLLKKEVVISGLGVGEISTMELIYLYVRKYGTIFQDQEFNFSSNFRASFKEN